MKRASRKLHRLMLGACAVLLAGCTIGTDPSDSSNPPCTITITGAAAIAGTYKCSQPAVSIWVASTNVGAVSLNISGTKSITGLFVFSGQPTANHPYSSDTNSSSLQSYGFLVSVGTSTWEFSAGQQKTALGSGSLTFSSVVATTAGSTGSTYDTHGVIDANLVPSPGTPASGNATMHIDF